MRRTLSTLAVLALVVCAGAQAQTGSISGTVTDPTGSPAAAVTVTLRSVDGALTRTAATDARGRYTFTGLPGGGYVIETSAQGFQTAVAEVDLADGESRRLDVRLQLGQIAEQLTVTGSRIQGAADTGAIAVSVLETDDLDAFGAVTTGEIYANIAQAGEMEFNETADGPNSARGDIATVNLRNLGAGNTLVLLNGRRLTPHPISQDISQTPQSVVNVNAIPSSAIDQVEVLRDGASALYGTDATAGVVNTVLDTRYEGYRVTLRQANSEGTDFQEQTFDFAGGTNFNNGRTNVTVFATVYTRDGMLASERDYSASVDKRPLLPPDWEGDSQFRNTSTRSPWGEFAAGALRPDGTFDGIRVRQDGRSLTSSSGRFHIQPADNSGGVPLATGVELDDGSLSTSLRYDFGIPRQITPDIDRDSIFGVLTHDLSGNRQLFFELGYYESDTFAQRAPQPMDDGLAFIIVPKQNYWNPFGPVGSPNRLPGIDAPAEGLDVLIRRYRPLEHGPRIIETQSDMFRILGGLRGVWKDWSWETAAFYNEAQTTDEEGNRISKTRFFDQLSLTTPDALNPFAGTGLGTAPVPCCPQPDAGAGPNPQSVLDAIRISSVNKGETSLTSWDFRASNPDQWLLQSGPVGVAFGGEWRREEYVDDRDPRLDGTIFYRQGEGSDLSDVIGVSPTLDSSGSRNVYSLYGEALVPLVGPEQKVPGVVRLDLQAAVRMESFDDTNEDVVKPKLALSWFPADWVIIRGAYSEGFRAPNLVQLNRGDISRLNQGQEDFWRSDVTGLPDDTGETYRRSVRISNPDLKSEETETIVAGFEIHPPGAKRVSFSVDYWQFEQDNVIDNFGAEEQMALDFLRRKQGSSNPNVVRLPVTPEDEAAFAAWNAANPDDQRAPAGLVSFVQDPYLNLDPRTVEGMDFGIQLRFDDTAAGSFRFHGEASYLMTFDQQRDSLAPLLADPMFAGEFEAQRVDRIGLNGKPEWRTSGSLTWRKGGWRAGASYKFVDEFFDTSARNDETDAFWTVDSWTVFNLFAEYSLKMGITVRAGVNNVADEDPPLADESRGYFSSYHNNRGRQYWLRLVWGR